ncbi:MULTISPECIES: carbohydrate ABC transporter permease [Virgibacillus]|uniref:Lactose ABC transporter permease n=1 Tax=Virgibacillus pantothenticus TaxID=1473 RepID=A0A0L0QM99_VIRPA|nr:MULTISPECIES: sugar ABC transporter permease [Virgibacillus]API93405.1 lactose ABC transporter permease [Virgibacillus sp. 6R]KNE19722.1 lactose ABC transporter permease [Virgibacillus pantothenticus]MBS7430229.1 sugar ABC transporter permease [Virgibacillus sp. 19R1-5]MBU8566215.1 sugar ABC transporter permease [Virgibacillus pantothenticus]MBU8602887.1 sugar ABC transporter permease [Virgibacillus pantothenticus]
MRTNKITPYLFLLPGCIILGAFIFYPMLQAIWMSFTDYNMITEPEFVKLDNYKNLFNDELFWKTLMNTFLYLICVVPALVIIPIFLAVLVNQKLRGIAFFRSAYYIPVVTSLVVAGIAWDWVYKENGLLNYMLDILGIISEPIPWLTSTDTALFAVMVVTVWKGLGYYMIIYLAGLQSIPSNLYEAAQIDGANWWQQVTRITIPMLMPFVLIVSIMSSIAAMKVFEEIYVMTGGGPLHSSETLVFYIYTEAFDRLNMGYASAAGVILFLLTLVFSIINLKFMGKDNTK